MKRTRWTNLVPALTRDGLKAEVAELGDLISTAEITIYDVIDGWGGEWGVSAPEVAAVLEGVGPVKEINLRLNSPGGDYFEGVAIAHALARHPATVTVHVDGLAASAASVIAMGADRIVMGQGSQMMIHEASSMEWGTANDMRRTAAMLDQTNEDIAALYAQRVGGEQATWRAAVAEETWYTAAQAVAAGLADEVTPLPQRAPDLVAARAEGAPSLRSDADVSRETAIDRGLAALDAELSDPAPVAVAVQPAVTAALPTLSEALCSALS